jgi:hypothetical protein
MRPTFSHSCSFFVFAIILLLTTPDLRAQAQKLNLKWNAREDLNILLPLSVRVFEANGVLQDGAKVRAMYARIDLRDKNLKLHAVGNNKLRETTLDAYKRNRAILAINGGYFSSTRSESLLVSDGELLAAGPRNFTRGAFGLVNGKPEIVWPFAIDSTDAIYYVKDPVALKEDQKPNPKTTTPWYPAQAVGGGPMLIKEGKIRDGSKEEGFGASHLLRHPRTAIGYLDEYTLLMMVVDGRQQSSAGVTITELAQMMLEAGCYEAVNLDGGGSSAMIAADEVVNVPVDIPNGNRNSLRRNASALVVTEEIPSADREVILIDTGDKVYSEQGVWQNSNHVNFYGTTASRQATSNSLNRAVYRFSEINSTEYQLAAWWTVSDKNTKQVSYILHRGKKVDSIHVDQSSISSNGRWNVLGNYFLTQDDYIEVLARDGKFVTDAIRLVRTGIVKDQPRRGDLRIAVISDLNSGLGSSTYEWQVDSIIQRIPRAWKPDLVVCGGDMVAGMGVSDTATLSKMWRGFNDHIAEPLRKKQIPFAFTIGNHDGLRSYATERSALSKYWSQPDHQTGLHFIDSANFPHYYSFEAGETFIISWDASSSEITQENLRWVEQQLQSDASKRSKARLVIGHLPIYSVAQERDSKGNVLDNGEELRKLLEKYRVKVYVSGHQHAYYPGKRGKLELLNAGAAGSGPRRWLTTDKAPVNTITIMDVFYNQDTITYTTYDIKHKSARDMRVFDHQELPSSISGVNGFIIRKDIRQVTDMTGTFYSVNPTFNNIKPYGRLNATVARNKISINGNFNLSNKPSKQKYSVKFFEGDFNDTGKPLFDIQVSQHTQSAKFHAVIDLTEPMIEKLAIGKYFVEVNSGQERLRGQLYPVYNTPPSDSRITSHNNVNIYGIRDTKGLYTFSWTPSTDRDGDKVFYLYQLASDSIFENPIISINTDQRTTFKLPESELYVQLKNSKKEQTFYHRVIVTDGLHVTVERYSAVRFTMSDELPTDFIELESKPYIFDGKIDNATGQGSGALWDKHGKLWLADYGGSLIINQPDGKAANFSPLQSVMINNKSYSLKPINGISLDIDGNILIGSNRLLIKVDTQTGKGIAVWEAPEGKRSITTPRANNKGEIYAMSLFAEDPNYVLRQSTTTPTTFDVVRTVNLPQRILSRTFDMSDDGLTLFFPDPGSPFIQVYKSNDGTSYKRVDDITSVEAGCNAIRYSNNTLFAAVRSSGISAATLHVRDEKQKVMWTLPLAELNGAEARGIAVSPDQKTIIICSWDNGGGFYRYRIRDAGY